MITLELITQQNAMIFKDVRLRALQDTPSAFGSTYAKESQLTDADWVKRAAQWTSERSAGYLAMSEKSWPSNYYRGQAVLLLIFHAVELFLKGFILKLAPATMVEGHSLAALTKKLKTLAPDIEFEPPFEVEALPPYPGLVRGAEEKEKRFHEVLRYPIGKKGKPWPGVRGFSASSCRRMLVQVRADCERVYVRVFEKQDG